MDCVVQIEGWLALSEMVGVGCTLIDVAAVDVPQALPPVTV
jgi:hypothetical protein